MSPLDQVGLGRMLELTCLILACTLMNSCWDRNRKRSVSRRIDSNSRYGRESSRTNPSPDFLALAVGDNEDILRLHRNVFQLAIYEGLQVHGYLSPFSSRRESQDFGLIRGRKTIPTFCQGQSLHDGDALFVPQYETTSFAYATNNVDDWSL